METTKEPIVAAYLQLLFEKSLEELTVKEIVQKAGISRSTFYLHFADKYELMDEVRRKLNDRFLSFYEMDYQWGKPITLHLCEHIFKYRSFYELEFAEADAIQKLSDKLAAHLQEVFQDPDYALFASYGTIGYLGFWVRNGYAMSPAVAAEKLLKIGLTNWTKVLDAKLDGIER